MVVAAVGSGWIALVSAALNSAVAVLWLIVCVVLLISAGALVLVPLPATTSRMLYGITLIDDGCEYYPDWCAMMLSEFADSTKSQLEHDYSLAKSIASHPRDQWPILIAKYLETDSP